MPKKTLPPEGLANVCDPALFKFKTTDDLPTLKEIIGQDRALQSIEFGLGITNHNYNIYVLGPVGTGKHTTVMNFIKEKSKEEPVPDDWCYVNNFLDPDAPVAINLPAGTGCEFMADTQELVDTLRRDIPRVFESKDYETHRDEILEGQQERTKAVFARLEQRAAEKGFILKKTVSGLVVLPAKDGKAMGTEDFERLSPERRAAIEADLRVLQDKLSDAIREARRIEKDTRDRITALDREVVQYVVNPLINELLDKYKEFENVVKFLQDVRENILENIDDFRPKEEMPLAIGPFRLPMREPAFERYRVNLIVNNKNTEGAPVVFETNPNYYNLFGRIDYKVQMGVATTDFTMIKGGSIHRANGGYLVVDALDILRNIFVYDSLKRMLKDRVVRIEDVWEQYRLISTVMIKPSPIPVNIKLVIVGEPFIYYLLYNLDSEYRKLFKVKADFDTVMPRDDGNVQKYAHFIATTCREEGLIPFDATGVAKVVEYGSRLAGDKYKLSTLFNEVQDMVVEASHWAHIEKAAAVGSSHVEKALEEKIYRNSRLEDRLRDFIKEDTLIVSTEGATVGQVNGIAVLDLGDYAFGKPSRITARTFMGEGGVVNIEREAKMSGRIHTKALMILTSFLGERFARDFPLALSASITFEQLYDEVEGDSATCAEVYALLSSLSGIPVDQGIAVTGSMNQRGEVQPVGGVNEKIEGFFRVCKTKGLTGSQGVIIPGRNVRSLMLHGEVREAVKQGRFHIYAMDSVDEGVEILMGVSAGERQPDGTYPEGTVNRLVSERLRDLATSLKAFRRPSEKKALKAEENTEEGKKKGPPPKPQKG